MEVITKLLALYRNELRRLRESYKKTVIIPNEYLKEFLYNVNLREEDVVLTYLKGGIVKVEFYY